MDRFLVVAVLATLLPIAAEAQLRTPEARIEAARNRVAQGGIPTSLIDDRVNEGRAKGVPAERIAEAVERRAAALQAAGDALSPTTASISAAELSAGADAIEAGIPGEALRAVVAGARSEDRPVALAVLTFLHREQGMPVDRALERVAQAMARGPDALRNLPAQSRPTRDRPTPPARPEAERPTRPGTRPPPSVPPPGERPGSTRPDDARPPSPPARPGRD